MSAWRLEDARFRFGKETFSVSVAAGHCTALVGSNGSGKTSLLRALLGERALTEGAAYVGSGSAPMAKLSLAALSRQIAFVPQEPIAPGGTTVRGLLEAGRFGKLGDWGRLTAEDRAYEEQLIERLGLTALGSRRLDHLSPGERQRAFVARGLVARAPLLLLDEPTNHLDPAASADLWAWIDEARRQEGFGVVVATHDLAAVAEHADWVVALREGAPVYVGPRNTFSESDLTKTFGRRLLLARQFSGDSGN